MTYNENEVETKQMFIWIVIGIVLGGLFDSLILYIFLGRSSEFIRFIALGITILFGLGILLIVYSVYYFKTYTIIEREKLNQLKEKEIEDQLDDGQ